jgi:hypothetical protein
MYLGEFSQILIYFFLAEIESVVLHSSKEQLKPVNLQKILIIRYNFYQYLQHK